MDEYTKIVTSVWGITSSDTLAWGYASMREATTVPKMNLAENQRVTVESKKNLPWNLDVSRKFPTLQQQSGTKPDKFG